MRLTITSEVSRHTEGCTAIAVAFSGDILSGGDDFCVWRWNGNGDPITKLIELESCVTFVAWMPGSGLVSAAGGKKKVASTSADASAKDAYILACADGTLRIVNAATSRVEKLVEAHTGAITALTFSPDGSTILTAGEDGNVKVWSQSGIQRSTIVSCGKCIYSLVWGAESAEYGGDCMLYTCGNECIVKPMNPSVKRQLKWKAHNGVVLSADWSRMSNSIVTGGEDGVYKVWDSYGRNIFTSVAIEHPITSISFSPDGEMFSVGSFLSLRVCDKTGWSHCCEHTKTGSVMAMKWTADGTQIVCGSGDGNLFIAQLVDRKLHWNNYTATLSDGKKLHIQDVLKNDAVEELEQRDKVIKLSMGQGYLVVCTTTQCLVYDVTRLSSFVQFDLRDSIVTLQLAEKHFLLADCAQGISIYSYEGRLISNIKLGVSLRPETLASNVLSISPETVAVRDPADPKKILLYEILSGKHYKELTVQHDADILDISLCQYGAQKDRKLTFTDRNQNLFLSVVHSKLPVHKLSTMASSVSWHDKNETLVAISDGRLCIWYFPTVVFVDRDLLARTKWTRDDGEEFTRNDHIVDFSATRVSVRRGVDGALLTFGVSPYPAMLFAHVARHDWDGATRLCRFLSDDTLWSILTAMAIRDGELNTAEFGYGALNEVDKLRYIHDLKSIPSGPGRQAELYLFQRRLEEAERILMQAGLVYRAIDLHTRLYNWERALDIAVERRTHVDTVMYRRQQYLDTIGKKESLDKFKQVAGSVKVDADVIAEKIQQELQKEKQRPS